MTLQSLADYVDYEVISRLRPLGIHSDGLFKVNEIYGDALYYGLEVLTKGSFISEYLYFLQGMSAPLSVNLPFVEMPNGTCAYVQVTLTDEECYLILTDDYEEKIRYQEILQASNETILGAYRRAQAEEALYREKELAEVTLNSIGDAVIRTDENTYITYLNPIAERMTGWPCREAVGRLIDEVFVVCDANTNQSTLQPIRMAIQENRIVGLAANSILVNRNGVIFEIQDSAAPIHNRKGEVMGAVLVFHDISKTQAMAIKMSHLAQQDYLTGLPNRVMLHDRITQAISLANRENKRVAVMFIDLDRFKYINDSLGHLVGDKLLKEVSTRFMDCIRNSDSVSRLGGDEFIVMMAQIESIDHVALLADKLLQLIAQPFEIDGDEICITLSIGISLFPEDGNDAVTLTRHADAAMYHAKENGRNNVQFFTQSMHERSMLHREISLGLRNALKQGELELYYQPKMRVDGENVVGFEALVRWRHPEKGIIEPDAFIPIAEESGLVSALGLWVINEACMQNKRWQEMGLPKFTVSVNISAIQFREKGFVKMVKAALRNACLEANYLELEMTESIIMQDVPYTTGLLNSLKKMGIKLSVDDFGTGYSSLAYLKVFPIDSLKIDQSFVRDIHTDPDDAAIVLAIINMAKSLKQKVIAEGVETLDQFNFLRRHHCDEIQGYYISQPLPVSDTEQFIRNNKFDTIIDQVS